MKTKLPGIVLFVAVLALAGLHCGGGGPRNCVVIPAQIELVKERREAMLADLEATARRVDRQAGTLASVRNRLETLQHEKALLDSLIQAEGGSVPAAGNPK